MGAGAVNQAVKAIAIARGYVAPNGIDLITIPAFAEIAIEGEERTAIRFIVGTQVESRKDRECATPSRAAAGSGELFFGQQRRVLPWRRIPTDAAAPGFLLVRRLWKGPRLLPALLRRQHRLYLKRLEFLGFKSFAEKTEIEMSDGITAVVGPNGSGKSNVADALRGCWASSPTCATCAGGATDVIFNGSEKRRALGLAEVSLTPR